MVDRAGATNPARLAQRRHHTGLSPGAGSSAGRRRIARRGGMARRVGRPYGICAIPRSRKSTFVRCTIMSAFLSAAPVVRIGRDGQRKRAGRTTLPKPGINSPPNIPRRFTDKWRISTFPGPATRRPLPTPPSQRKTLNAFNARSFVQIIRILAELDQRKLLSPFFNQLIHAVKKLAGWRLITDLAKGHWAR